MKQLNPTKTVKKNLHMMRIRLIFSIFLVNSFAFAQDYSWMNGSSLIDQPGTYGTMGVSSPGNVPGARDYAVSWKDTSGNFWLFGGFGYGASATAGYLNDLWKYNVSTNQWTWINGNNVVDQNGVYGTMGISSPLNKPGSRGRAMTWVDVSGNFWMFGGLGLDSTSNGGGPLNDLWKYNISTNEWTWVNGNSGSPIGVYGTPGIASNNNTPGSRFNAATWADATGNFWMFGGMGVDSVINFGDLNDLWKYNIASNQWTWISGSATTGQNGTYGNMGVPAAANLPGGRYLSAYWRDNAGNLWLFGGAGFDATSTVEGGLNDLWRYNISTNQWTWINGSNTVGQPGVYGIQGAGAPSNMPGCRAGCSSWADASGSFFMFGGSPIPNSAIFMNDLWKYNLATNQWTWMKGSNAPAQSGIYGSQGTPATVNTPGARGGAPGWTDASGNLWLFGGQKELDTTGINPHDFNDLWKLTLCSASPSVTIASSSSSFCKGGSATLTATGANTFSWSNSQTGSVTVISPTVAGFTTLTCSGFDLSGCGGTGTIGINVFPLPIVNAVTSKTAICKGQKATLSASGAINYSWNTIPTSAASSVTVSPTVTTIYVVTGTDVNGCSKNYSVTQIVNLCTGVDERSISAGQYVVYPNPNNGAFAVQGSGFEEGTSLFIFNMLGQKVFEENLISDQTQIQSQLQRGVYHYSIIQHNQKISSGKIMIE